MPPTWRLAMKRGRGHRPRGASCNLGYGYPFSRTALTANQSIPCSHPNAIGKSPPIHVEPSKRKSGRGLPQSKTLRGSHDAGKSARSWSAPALWRFGTGPEMATGEKLTLSLRTKSGRGPCEHRRANCFVEKKRNFLRPFPQFSFVRCEARNEICFGHLTCGVICL